jgi:hypothetical protein
MRMKYASFFLLLILCGTSLTAQYPRFKALAFYSEKVEPAHVEFAHDAIRFFRDLTVGDGFVFDITNSMDDLMSENLGDYSVYEYGAWKPDLFRSDPESVDYFRFPVGGCFRSEGQCI